MNRFSDHFSAVAGDYARFRPRYPRVLFDHLARCCSARADAWDCATGNGQAAVALAEFFDRVIATDASADQISRALSHSRVEYRVASAEACNLDTASVDLVTVAQALHWFDRPRFYAEVRRVLRPGGLLAVWTYARVSVPDHPELTRLIDDFHDRIVGPYWPPERPLVESGYRDIEFPFRELQAPAMAMVAELTLDDLLGYFGTWSSVQRYRRALGHDPLPPFRTQLAATWGEASQRRKARWPLALRLGAC